MKKRIFVLCDAEKDYCMHFTEYIYRKRNIPFEFQTFTEEESLVEFGKRNKIGILLISESMYCKKITALEPECLVILSEEKPGGEQGEERVWKYQPASAILRETMRIFGEEELSENAGPRTGNAELLGVYSPVRRCGSSTFALAAGQILSARKHVLLMNLEGYAGWEELLGMDRDAGLDALLYYARERKSSLTQKLPGIVHTINRLDVIPPVRSPEDVRSADYAEWKYLLEEIAERGGYELIILDLGSEIDGLFQILYGCRWIFVPTLQDASSAAKLHQFRSLLEEKGYEELPGRIRYIKLKDTVPAGRGEKYAEQLLYGPAGADARRYLQEAGLI